MKRLYVGNLPFTATEADIRAAFQEFGPVQEVKIITDRETGNSRGFGFVSFTNDPDGQRAIQSLNGFRFNGRALTVNEAAPKAPTGGGGGYRTAQASPGPSSYSPSSRPVVVETAPPARGNARGGRRNEGGGGRRHGHDGYYED